MLPEKLRVLVVKSQLTELELHNAEDDLEFAPADSFPSVQNQHFSLSLLIGSHETSTERAAHEKRLKDSKKKNQKASKMKSNHNDFWHFTRSVSFNVAT